MTLIASILLCSLFGVVVVQTLTTLRFINALNRQAAPPIPDAKSPRTVVILCLRGPDPFLEETLRAILNQDYPDFELRIVVDGDADPAWDTVRRIVNHHSRCRVTARTLTEPADTCSLKCSSVVQVIRDLDSSFDVIALLDADTIPHRTWLRELVAPLAAPDVAVTTGNRWYMPDNPTLGSMVRYIWNAAAVVQMVCFKIAWGGTLAIKRSALEQAELIKHWENALCEDTMLFQKLKNHGLRQVFVPSLMMVNRECCTLNSFSNWVTRQLLTARLYHPSWPATVIHCAAATLAPVVTLAALGAAAVGGEWNRVGVLAVALLIFELSWLLLLAPTEWMLQRIVARRRESTRWLSLSVLTLIPVAILVTQLVYPMTLLLALFASSVEWRGVRYRIFGRRGIRRVTHPPVGLPPISQAGQFSL